MTETEKNTVPTDKDGENGEKPSFEAAAAQLEEIVGKLNSGTAMLDEMIALYEKGVALSDYCRKLLEDYEGRIEKAVRRSAKPGNE